jgi:hypothetical protein
MSRRRHRNPSMSDSMDIGMLLLFGVGAYLLYQVLSPLLSTAGSAVSSAANSATTAVANLFPGTSPSVVPQGTVLLPGGGSMPVSSLTSNGFNADGSLNMTDASGNSYSVTSLGNGIYQAN